MRKFVLVLKSPIKLFQAPYLWASAKTYYEEQGRHTDQWSWMDPIHVDDINETVRTLVEAKPDLVGFSLYIWNEKTMYEIARRLRDALPDTKIMFGGPQQDIKYNKEYFRERPYVDLVVPGDAYGEILIKETLDSITENDGQLIPTQLPYCYFPSEDRGVLFNDIPLRKRDYEWPANPYRAQQELFDRFKETRGVSTHGWMILETSRGCPFRCSFCDWGGGTYTKTVKKPFATVMDEIRWAAENKFYGIMVTDANFGMFDIDIEYARFMAEMKSKHGFPVEVDSQPNKTKLKNQETIFDIFAGSKQMTHLKVASEDINEHVLKNIERVDFPFEAKMEMFLRLRSNHPHLRIWLEGILGLPGSSLECVINDIDRTLIWGTEFAQNHSWALLPEAPAYDPEYREKFKIKTVKNKSQATGWSLIPIKPKDGVELPPGVFINSENSEDRALSSAEYVVETSTYSRQEYVEMTELQIFVQSFHNARVLDLLARYVREQHGMKYGEFYMEAKSVLSSDSELGTQFRKVNEALSEWVNSDRPDWYIDYDPDFPFEISPHSFFQFVALSNPERFYGILGEHFSKMFDDQTIPELARFSMARNYHIDYKIRGTYDFSRNWKEYAEGGQLKKEPTTYRTLDHLIQNGNTEEEELPINWRGKKGTPEYLTHFFYRVCYNNRIHKTVRQIERI